MCSRTQRKRQRERRKKAQSSALLECAAARRMEAARRGEQRGSGVRAREKGREIAEVWGGRREAMKGAREGAAECAPLSVVLDSEYLQFLVERDCDPLRLSRRPLQRGYFCLGVVGQDGLGDGLGHGGEVPDERLRVVAAAADVNGRVASRIEPRSRVAERPLAGFDAPFPRWMWMIGRAADAGSRLRAPFPRLCPRSVNPLGPLPRPGCATPRGQGAPTRARPPETPRCLPAKRGPATCAAGADRTSGPRGRPPRCPLRPRPAAATPAPAWKEAAVCAEGLGVLGIVPSSAAAPASAIDEVVVALAE